MVLRRNYEVQENKLRQKKIIKFFLADLLVIIILRSTAMTYCIILFNYAYLHKIKIQFQNSSLDSRLYLRINVSRYKGLITSLLVSFLATTSNRVVYVVFYAFIFTSIKQLIQKYISHLNGAIRYLNPTLDGSLMQEGYGERK